MAELSAGLDLSNIGTTTREVQGITSTATHFTGFESPYPARSGRPTRLLPGPLWILDLPRLCCPTTQLVV